MKLGSILRLLLATALIVVVNSQIPLPKRPLGFIYKGGEPSAPIHLTAFVDLTCPDSQQAWPTVKKVADMYGPTTILLTVQLFPLPYHTNAFMAAQVSRKVLNKANLFPSPLPSFFLLHAQAYCFWRLRNYFNRIKNMSENA